VQDKTSSPEYHHPSPKLQPQGQPTPRTLPLDSPPGHRKKPVIFRLSYLCSLIACAPSGTLARTGAESERADLTAYLAARRRSDFRWCCCLRRPSEPDWFRCAPPVRKPFSRDRNRIATRYTVATRRGISLRRPCRRCADAQHVVVVELAVRHHHGVGPHQPPRCR
jgi:hypothetical protein